MTDSGARDQRDAIVKAAFQYRDALLSYSFGLLRDWAKAEDVLQDAFLVVMDKWQDVTDPGGVYAWVRRIVHYKALEALRARAREVRVEEEDLLRVVEKTLAAHLDQRAAEHQGRMRSALRECMSQLSHFSVSLLTGFYWNLESCEALAAVNQRSTNAVRLALSRLRGQLRDCMTRRMQALES